MTSDELKSLFEYDPETGVFTWLCGQKKGRAAGCLVSEGYIRIRINKRLWMAHRLAWIYMTGDDTSLEIDHINGDRSDNRFSNLRTATSRQNKLNRRVKNVDYFRNKYRVKMRIDGKDIHIGVFACPELAALVASEYRDKYHGGFARAL